MNMHPSLLCLHRAIYPYFIHAVPKSARNCFVQNLHEPPWQIQHASQKGLFHPYASKACMRCCGRTIFSEVIQSRFPAAFCGKPAQHSARFAIVWWFGEKGYRKNRALCLRWAQEVVEEFWAVGVSEGCRVWT